MEDYYSEENVKARVKAIAEQADMRNASRRKQEERDYFDSLMLLIGHAIVAVKKADTDEDTYIIFLDDGTQITAVDGEYDSNAFIITRRDG